MLLRRAGLTASAGLSCCFTLFRDWFKQHTDMRIGSLFELSQPGGRCNILTSLSVLLVSRLTAKMLACLLVYIICMPGAFVYD